METTIKRDKKKKFYLIYCSIFLLIILFTISACRKGEAFYQFQELPDANWKKGEALVFQIDSGCINPDDYYDISLEIANNVDYPYQNLWLVFQYKSVDSVQVKTNEEFIIADEYARWEGAGFASLYQSSHLVKYRVRLDPNKSTLAIKHGMTDSLLHGIEKVGLKIEKSKGGASSES